MLVRGAEQQDLDWLIGQLKEFSRFFGSHHVLFPHDDEAYARNGLSGMMEKHLVLVAEREDKTPIGFVAGIVTPHLFNPKLRVLCETFWWVIPEARMSLAASKLLDAFTKWGQEHADWIIFSLEERTPVRDRGLLRRGFRLQERSYLMEVE